MHASLSSPLRAFDDVKYTKKNRINEVKVNRTRNKEVKSAFVKDYGQTELSGERCFDVMSFVYSKR